MRVHSNLVERWTRRDEMETQTQMEMWMQMRNKEKT